jgi:hypothetical protein
MTAKPRRRLQFSLKALMLLVAVAALPCGWVKWRMIRKERERAAVAEIETVDGQGYYDWQAADDIHPSGPKWLRTLFGEDFFADITSVFINCDDLTDEWLRHLEPLTALSEITLESSQLSDAGIRYLTRWKGLTAVRISNARTTAHYGAARTKDSQFLRTPGISDDGLECLARLPRLKELWIEYACITDAGVVHLKALPNLEDLKLQATEITDAGAEFLSTLTKLRFLDLADTSISDRGIVHLKNLSRLEELIVWNTNVTDKGIEDLQKALPNCHIWQ